MKATKRFQVKEVKGDKGEILAVIATLNVIDHDGDVTLPGAFGEQEAAIQPAHGWMAPALGKAAISETSTEALANMKFNLEMPSGKEWYQALKFDFETGAAPLQEYSYGYDPIEADPGVFDGQDVRFLKKLKVFEVSPLLLGAGINTRTLAVKSGIVPVADLNTLTDEFDNLETLLAGISGFYGRAKALAAMRAKEGRSLSGANRERLGRLFGAVNTIRDEIQKFLEDTDPAQDRDDGKGAALYAQFQQKQFEINRILRG